MTTFRSYWVVALLVPVGTVLAQQPPHPFLPPPNDSLRWTMLGFERVLNTFLWNGRLRYGGLFDRMTFQTEQSIRSRVIRADQRSLQDEYGASVALGIPLAERLSLQAQLTSNVLSDDRLIDFGQLAQHQALVGLGYALPAGITVRGMGGYEYNGQGGVRDGGFAYLVGVEGKNLRLEEFRTTLQARTTQSYLAPRRQRDDSLAVLLDRDFGGSARNMLSIRLNNQRREFYLAADSGVQRQFGVQRNIFGRESAVLNLANRLMVKTSDDLQVTVEGGLSSRTIDRRTRYKDFSRSANAALDTRVEELQLFGSMGILYRLPELLEGQVEISYREREERHTAMGEDAPFDLLQRQEAAARRLGNVTRQTILRSQQAVQLSERNQLNLVGSASILRYDTPDTLNTDDRDELLLMVGVEGTHTTRPLRVALSIDAALNHVVYLHRQQSANNYWNRVIRFSPRVEYTPAAWLATVNRAEVVANYTVYDFEDQVAFVRSFSFRQASWVDSTVMQLTPRIVVQLLGSIRIYERGILRWKEFTERPQNAFVEQSFWPQVKVNLSGPLTMGIGYRTFVQDRYRYVGGNREFERRLATAGPTAMLEWESPGFSRIGLQGWREHQEEDGHTIRTLSHLLITMSVTL
jgi:hypothetical protein